MSEADKEDRTEAPSARRLEKAREDGDVASSRELQALLGLGLGVAALTAAGPDGAMRFAGHMRRVMDAAGGL
ncbi:MAG: EscU/YscU/HrcU family type III secretion system export apparatus switch protein, partial [Gluconacetobacter diazotrophicus]|nr:EscU/YscU/HrcU family type III secretion system export apparatus switch protein [Gluconacetobacter diazotrophicus]